MIKKGFYLKCKLTISKAYLFDIIKGNSQFKKHELEDQIL